MSTTPFKHQAKYYAEKTLDAAKHVDALPTWTWVYLSLTAYHAGIGELEQAEKLALQGMGWAKKMGDLRRFEDFNMSMGYVAALAGDFQNAYRYCDTTFQSASKRQDRQYQIYGLLGRAAHQFSLKRFEDVDHDLDQLMTLIGTPDDRKQDMELSVYIDFHALFALRSVRNQAFDEAQTAITAACEHYESQGKPNLIWLIVGLQNLTECAFSLGESPNGPKLAKQCLSYLQAMAKTYPICSGISCYWLGEFYCQQGNLSKANQYWQRCLTSTEYYGLKQASAAFEASIAASTQAANQKKLI